ncbi:MAG TPA: cytochrome P450 [Pilimelia sp.]|nr:cytochrome P450 [Pilimelia sp.]
MTFPFPVERWDCAAAPYAARLAGDPLGRVRVPSGDSVVLAARYADVAAILADPRFSRELFHPEAPRYYPDFDISDAPDAMINMDPPEHTRLRRLTANTFTARRIEVWRPRVRDLVHALLDSIDDEVVDFVQAVAFPLPVRAICDVMGVTEFDWERVRSWSQALISSSGRTVDERIVDALEFAGYIIELIQRHRAEPGDGLLSALIDARDEGDQLTDAELVRIAQGLFVGGHESTSVALSRAALRLLAPPVDYRRLVADPRLIDAAVEEILRVEVPIETAFIRLATEDVDLPSGKIRQGDGVLPCLRSANHDPAVYPDADAFDLDREARPHLAFGRGPHHCLGAGLARMELQEALRVLVTRLPNLSLAEDPDAISWHRDWVHKPTRVLVNLGRRG